MIRLECIDVMMVYAFGRALPREVRCHGEEQLGVEGAVECT